MNLTTSAQFYVNGQWCVFAENGNYIKDFREVSVWGTVEDFTVKLHEAAAGLDEPQVRLEDEPYDPDTMRFVVVGWRSTTPQEKNLYNNLQGEEEKRLRGRLEEAERLLREHRPDIFE